VGITKGWIMLNWRKSFVDRIARWKIDLGISSQYLSPFFAFQTLATIIYATFNFISSLFSGYLIIVYYGFSCLVFLLVFKVFAKLVLWMGFYHAERDYERKINPFEVDRASEKDKNYSIPLTVTNVNLAIQNARMLILWGDKNYGAESELWKRERQETLRLIEELKQKRDKYNSLRFKS
jgi:hypothetical protein